MSNIYSDHDVPRLFHFRIVVSAPYGQAAGARLQRSSTSFGDIPATGVIYTCTLSPSVCMGLTGDGEDHDRRLYDIDGWYFVYVYSNSSSSTSCISGNIEVAVISDGNQGEEKRGQFLGATLKSTGDRFLVRYFYAIMEIIMLFICFDVCRHVVIDTWIMVWAWTVIRMGCVIFQEEVFRALVVIDLVVVSDLLCIC